MVKERHQCPLLCQKQFMTHVNLKKLNGIMSHLGLCTIYEEVERTDTAMV